MSPHASNSAGNDHGPSFNNFRIYNSQGVHVGDHHVYNNPNGLDSSRLAEALRKRSQPIDRKEVPKLKGPEYRLPEAQIIPSYYKLLPHIKSQFPDLKKLTPSFETDTKNEAVTSLARYCLNKLRIKGTSNPLGSLVGDCLRERLDRVQADLDDGERLYKESHKEQWKKAIGTGVEIAIMKDNVPILDLLLKRGANINGLGHDKSTLEETPLLFAIGIGSLTMVKELISRGANVNMRSGPVDCPLKAAVLLRFTGIAKVLVSAGAKILDTTGNFGNSLLAASSLINFTDCLAAILEQLSDQELAGGAIAHALLVALHCGNNPGKILLLNKAWSLQGISDVSLRPSGLLKCSVYFNSAEVAQLALTNQKCVSALEVQTSLEDAAASGDFGVLDVFVRHGNTVSDFFHPDQLAALSLAVQKRNKIFAYYFATKGKHIYVHNHRSSALQFAVLQCNLDFVKLLIRQGAPLNPPDGESVIKWAFEAGHEGIARYLVEKGARLDPAGITAMLEYAANSSKLQVFEDLAQRGAVIRFPEHDKALKIAIQKGDIEITRFLVRNGINNRPAGDSDVLEIAARQGYLETVQFLVHEGFEITGNALGNAIKSGNNMIVGFLLKKKPSIITQENKPDLLAMAVNKMHGQTTVTIAEHGVKRASDYSPAIQNAVDNGDIEIVKYLVSLGAPATDELAEMAVAKRHYNVTTFLLGQGVTLRRSNSHLEWAVKEQSREWVELLLKQKANSNYISSHGSPLLNIAVSAGDRSIVTLLLEHGANPNYGGPSKSALALAVDNGSLHMIRLLIDNGANPNGMHSLDQSLLAESVRMRKPAMVAVLVENGADPNPANNSVPKHSILNVAIRNGDELIVQTLLNRMCTLRGPHGAESLRLAVKGRHVGIAESLVKAGAEFRVLFMEQSSFLRAAVDRRDTRMIKFLRQQGATFTRADGASALATALHASDELMVKECLKAGADPNHKNINKSPLNIAAASGKWRLMELLLKHGADPNDNLLHSGSDCLQSALTHYYFGHSSFGHSSYGKFSTGEDAGRCIALLVKAGAKTENLSKYDREKLDKALEKQPNFPGHTSIGTTSTAPSARAA